MLRIRVIFLSETNTYAQLAIILDCLFIVFLHVIGEIVDGDIIMFNILHDLCYGQGRALFKEE